MNKIPRISETEWEVMKVVWAASPCTALDVFGSLKTMDSSWHLKTLKTLLARLVQKRALTFKKEGRAYIYRPAVKQTDCVTAASETFLEKVFGGSLRPMIAHFVEHRKLSGREIAELKRVLEEH